MSTIVPFDDLCKMSGYTSPAQVAAWMQQNGIPYLPGKRGRPATTLDAINARLGVDSHQPPAQSDRPVIEV